MSRSAALALLAALLLAAASSLTCTTTGPDPAVASAPAPADARSLAGPAEPRYFLLRFRPGAELGDPSTTRRELTAAEVAALVHEARSPGGVESNLETAIARWNTWHDGRASRIMPSTVERIEIGEPPPQVKASPREPGVRP